MVEALPAVHVNRRDSLLDYPFSKLSDSTLEPLDSFQHTLLDIFNSIGALGLRRSNRQDLSALSDGSIHEARDSINDLIQILLPPPQQSSLRLINFNEAQRALPKITTLGIQGKKRSATNMLNWCLMECHMLALPMGHCC